MSDIYKAIADSCSDLHQNAQKLLVADPIPDPEFKEFLRGIGDMDWLPFELSVPKGQVEGWRKANLPDQAERRSFLKGIAAATHPSLI